MSDDRFDRDEPFDLNDAESVRVRAALRAQIHSLLVATWPRWWEPRDLENALIARRVPRTLRDMMAEDRLRPFAERLYEEREVPNVNNSQKHKVYRALIRSVDPTLF